MLIHFLPDEFYHLVVLLCAYFLMPVALFRDFITIKTIEILILFQHIIHKSLYHFLSCVSKSGDDSTAPPYILLEPIIPQFQVKAVPSKTLFLVRGKPDAIIVGK